MNLSILCVLALVTYLLTANLRSTPDPVDYLPHNTVALVQWKDLAATYSLFKSSPLGKEVLQEDFAGKLQKLKLPDEVYSQTIEGINSIRKAGEHPLFTMIFSRRSSIALLPGEYEVLSLEEYLTKNSVLITRLKVPFGQGGVFQKLMGKTFRTKTELYQGTPITRIMLQSGQSLYYTLIDRTFLGGLDPRPIERCVAYYNDRLLRPTMNLMHDEHYAALAGKPDYSKDFSIYVDLAPIETLMVRVNPEGENNTLPLQDKGRLYFHHTGKDALSKFELTFYNPDNEQQSLFDRYFYQSPGVSSHLQRVEHDASLYIWTNWLDYAHLWNNLAVAPSLETATMMFFIGQKVYEHTQLDIDTIASMFSSEAGVYIRDVPSVADTRIPMICFQFRLRQPESMKTFLDRILTEIPTRKVDIDGNNAVAVMMAGGLIQPAYAFMEDYLVIADSVDMLQRFITIPERSLLEDKSFKQVKDNFEYPGNFMAYARIDKINHGLQTVISWGLAALERSGHLSEQQKETIQSSLLHPLFLSMDNVHSQSIRFVHNNDNITLKTALFLSRDG